MVPLVNAQFNAMRGREAARYKKSQALTNPGFTILQEASARAVDRAVRRNRAEAPKERDGCDIADRTSPAALSRFIAEVRAHSLIHSHAHRHPNGHSQEDVARAARVAADLNPPHPQALDRNLALARFQGDRVV